MKIHQVKDVFTPTKPATLTFIEREELNDQLVDALYTPGKQIVIYGPSRSGKTTLLVNKLHQTYENHITTRCTSDSTFENILLSAFDKLDKYYLYEKSQTVSSSISASLVSDYKLIKSDIGLNASKSKEQKFSRVIPPQLTAERLAEFVGAANCCWVLEDFHKVSHEEKQRLSQIMKIFMDTASDYENVKIIAIGAVDTARQVIEYDKEMENRVAEILVPLMTKEKIMQIIIKGQILLNFKITDSVKTDIAKYSSGLASVCHQLCLNICLSAGIRETLDTSLKIKTTHLQKAIERYLKDSSDTLKSVFDKALRQKRERTYDNCRLILHALTIIGNSGATHAQLLTQIHKEEDDYPPSNLTSYLKQLSKEDRGEIIRYDPYSKKYSFSDPIYQAYAHCLFQPSSDKDKATISDSEFIKLLEGYVNQLIKEQTFSRQLQFNFSKTRITKS